MTPDPYLASGGTGSPSSWNRYAYVSGDPVNFYDPKGLWMDAPSLMYPGELGGGGGGGPWFGVDVWGLRPWEMFTTPIALLAGANASDEEEDDDPECFAQLKYRPVSTDGLKPEQAAAVRLSGATHSFWWVQDRTGQRSIITAGPSEDGKLRTWIVRGDTNGGEDHSGQTTAFDSGLSAENCDKVDQMMNAANFLDALNISYNYLGPNSNSAARRIGNRGGFYPSRPPRAIGWNAGFR